MTLIKGVAGTEDPGAKEDTVELVFEPIQESMGQDARIKVIGVGGGGGNATQRMRSEMSNSVEVICVNTDAQVLRDLKVGRAVQIGRETTQGLGAGSNPDIGRQAALESREQLIGLVDDADMLFITAGMGGGTGTGAAPVIARLAREAGILTVAVVTRPFSFEGDNRAQFAEQGIREISAHVDSIITIPNDRLLSELGDDIRMDDAFLEADKVLHRAVSGISDLILCPGTINVDFADVRTVMAQKGMAMMGTGVAEGAQRAIEATQQAINCQLLDEVNITNARAMLVNVTTARDGLKLSEFGQVAEELKPLLAPNAQNVMGTTYDESLGDQIKVTLVVAGYGDEESEAATPILEALPTTAARKIIQPRAVSGQFATSVADKPADAVGTRYRTEGNLATKPEVVPAGGKPDWSDGNQRAQFDVPAYLRKQHD